MSDFAPGNTPERRPRRGGKTADAKRLPPPLADDLDQGVEPGTNSRTSCAQRQATAILPAHSNASSREGTSTTENPPMYALLSGYGPSVTVPSVVTTLTSSWKCSPPPNTQTPASFASCTTACAASATSGRSSSGNVIAPSSNEIRYRVISRLLSRRPAPAASHLLRTHAQWRPTNHRELIGPARSSLTSSGVIAARWRSRSPLRS